MTPWVLTLALAAAPGLTAADLGMTRAQVEKATGCALTPSPFVDDPGLERLQCARLLLAGKPAAATFTFDGGALHTMVFEPLAYDGDLTAALTAIAPRRGGAARASGAEQAETTRFETPRREMVLIELTSEHELSHRQRLVIRAPLAAAPPAPSVAAWCSKSLSPDQRLLLMRCGPPRAWYPVSAGAEKALWWTYDFGAPAACGAVKVNFTDGWTGSVDNEKCQRVSSRDLANRFCAEQLGLTTADD